MTRALLALLAAVALTSAGVSGADFTASSSSPTPITAAADFNTVAISFSAPATTLVGSVALAATASSNRGVASVKFEYAPTGTADWAEICTDATPAYGCNWDTTSVPDGSYSVRATATDSAGYTRSGEYANRTIDNTTLTVTLADPGAMSGTKQLSATAANASGGLSQLRIQHRAAGATTWTPLCSGVISPQNCNLDTTALPDGPHELRATARDGANHEVVSTMITRTVDNSPPQTTSNIPATGSGTVTMTADAQDDGSGIKYVAFQVNYQGNWYEVCRDTTAPYTCAGDSSLAEDGTYNVRTVTENNAGVIAYGSQQQITVNNPPRGTDVATGNVGTAGQLSSGDWIRFTWNEPIAPASVMAGWNGSSTAIRVHVADSGSNDRMDFMTIGGARLNLVLSAVDLPLGANFVSDATVLDATISQTGTAITVTLGSWISGTLQNAGAGTITWRPSSAATDVTGKPSSTATVTEPGGADTDF